MEDDLSYFRKKVSKLKDTISVQTDNLKNLEAKNAALMNQIESIKNRIEKQNKAIKANKGADIGELILCLNQMTQIIINFETIHTMKIEKPTDI